jgi:hypothetical protein
MYYPKSQITTNLYTNGNEYQIKGDPTNSPYIGPYYKLSSGKVYLGKSPQSINILLIPLSPPEGNPSIDELEKSNLNGEVINNTSNMTTYYGFLYSDNKNVDDYLKLKSYTPRMLPSPHHSTSSSKDTQIGEYQRYFAKKTNELIYIEVSKETYTKFNSNDPTVASDLYNVLSLPWSLDRDAESTNRKIVALVEKNNKWYGFSKYFKDNFTS